MLINSKEFWRGDAIKKEKNGRPERNLLHCGFFWKKTVVHTWVYAHQTEVVSLLYCERVAHFTDVN
jgi:hypothetical protein